MTTRAFCEFEQVERCFLAGTCLTPAEVKKLLKKCGYRIKGLPGIHAHRMLVKHSADDKVLAGKISTLLESHYSVSGRQWMNKTVECRIHIWRESLGQQDIRHMLWAGLVFGDAQFRQGLMTDFCSFRNSCVILANSRLDELNRSRAKFEKFEEKYKASRRRERNLRREKGRSETNVRQLEQKLREVEKQKPAEEVVLHDDHGDIKVLGEKLSSAESELKYSRKKVLNLQRALSDKEDLVENYREANRLALNEISSLLEKLKLKESDCSVCLEKNLCRRNVLIVGGITKLKVLYRELVIKSGGDFRYHTGRAEGGEQMLKNGIGWADVVLCPVDVNSHRAALSVKKICRKMDKPFMMLRKSSISSISRALDEIALG